MPMPDFNKQPGGLGANELEMIRKQSAMGALEYGRGGSAEVLRNLKNPEAVRLAIREQMAAMVGLPAVMAWKEIPVVVIEKNKLVDGVRTVPLMSNEELLQIFASPDWMANRKGAGYYAQTSIETVCNGSTREDILEGTAGPGKYEEQEARELVEHLIAEKKLILADDVDGSIKEAAVARFVGKLKPEAMQVAEVIRQEAKRLKAVTQIWGAFQQHQATAGDEKAGAGLFVAPDKISPMGADWLVFFNDGGLRDAAMRQIYATGLTMQELRSQGKEGWSIEGIHWVKAPAENREDYYEEMIAEGKEDELQLGKDYVMQDLEGKDWKNVYADGFNSENFKAWMGALLDVTGGDMLAAYEAWYTSIETGLVAKVAKSGVNVGDPPLVSSIQAWLMHFREKQLNEAGMDSEGKRKKQALYKGKTGPIFGIDKYEASWIQSFFDSAEVGSGKNKQNVFEMWWDDDVEMGKIPWLNTDQTVGGQDEEVRMGSYDGWLYKIFQMNNLLEMIQKTPAMKDTGALTFWQGFARQMDKAFGPVWQQDVAVFQKEAEARGIDIEDRTNKMVVDGVKFLKVVPDEENPRYLMLQGIVTRYAPLSALRDEIKVDSAIALGERYSLLSEINLNMDVVAKLKQLQDPGTVLLENVLVGYIEAGCLTPQQVYDAMSEILKPEKLKAIYKSGTSLGNKTRSYGVNVQ